LLLDAGLSHMQGTGVLVLVNIFFIILVFSLQSIGTLALILLVLSLAFLLSTILFVQAKKKREG
jgi:uncharacterized membrane protein